MRWRDAQHDPPKADGVYFVETPRMGKCTYGFKIVKDRQFDDHENGRSGWGLGEQPTRWIDESDSPAEGDRT